MKLLAFTFGTYQCAGTTMQNTYFLDPDRIIGVRARVMGRTQSEVMVEGADPIVVEDPPEKVASLIEKVIRDAEPMAI